VLAVARRRPGAVFAGTGRACGCPVAGRPGGLFAFSR
jgi:hypothetical protein